jgi:hypothetical protein
MERAATHRTADKDAEDVIPFSRVGLYQQKTKQNQNLILVDGAQGRAEAESLYLLLTVSHSTQPFH